MKYLKTLHEVQIIFLGSYRVSLLVAEFFSLMMDDWKAELLVLSNSAWYFLQVTRTTRNVWRRRSCVLLHTVTNKKMRTTIIFQSGLVSWLEIVEICFSVISAPPDCLTHIIRMIEITPYSGLTSRRLYDAFARSMSIGLYSIRYFQKSGVLNDSDSIFFFCSSVS